MNNFERGERLIKDAYSYAREAEKSFAEQQWNRVIRRAQEAVELYLKGIMKILNIEFPKIHDVGRVFVEEVRKKKIKMGEKIARKIAWASSALAEMRAPAFYREKEYHEEEAGEAIENMHFVEKVIKKLLKELKNEK